MDVGPYSKLQASVAGFLTQWSVKRFIQFLLLQAQKIEMPSLALSSEKGKCPCGKV
jgi:hypothetical protein